MFNREKLNFLYKWWLVVDRRLLSIFFTFIILSCVFIFSSSVSVANRINVDNYYFFERHICFVVLAIFSTLTISLFSDKLAKKSIFLLFFVSLLLLVMVNFIGFQTKGARRWLYLFGISIQPTEFIKPSLILINAYFLDKFYDMKNTKYILFSVVLYVLCAFFIFKQPDIGTLVLLTTVFFTQLFLLDFIDFRWCLYFLVILIPIAIIAYITMPHVTDRINNFIISIKDPSKAAYQVKRSLMCYQNSSWLGKGFIEGEVKNFIPDVHTDFIFPAITEEFGFVFAFLIVLLYFYTSVRILLKTINNKDQFVFFALYGLGLLFLTQTTINIGVSLNLLPTKGMTLPFLSYGGSSLLGMSITFGFVLVFTRKKFDFKQNTENIVNDIPL
jgi:cell division protein FtsW